MGAAFDRLVYVFSYRVASDGRPTSEILFPRLYKARVIAQSMASDCPNWNSQKVVEITVRLYHPEDEHGDTGMPTRMWRHTEVDGVLAWLPVDPVALADLADPAVREKLDSTWKR